MRQNNKFVLYNIRSWNISVLSRFVLSRMCDVFPIWLLWTHLCISDLYNDFLERISLIQSITALTQWIKLVHIIYWIYAELTCIYESWNICMCRHTLFIGCYATKGHPSSSSSSSTIFSSCLFPIGERTRWKRASLPSACNLRHFHTLCMKDCSNFTVKYKISLRNICTYHRCAFVDSAVWFYYVFSWMYVKYENVLAPNLTRSVQSLCHMLNKGLFIDLNRNNYCFFF